MLRFFDKRQNGANGRDPRQALVTLHKPKSAASEAYRMLRTNIHFSSGGDSLKVIVVTSTFPEEGKSLTAVQPGNHVCPGGRGCHPCGCGYAAVDSA